MRQIELTQNALENIETFPRLVLTDSEQVVEPLDKGDTSRRGQLGGAFLVHNLLPAGACASLLKRAEGWSTTESAIGGTSGRPADASRVSNSTSVPVGHFVPEQLSTLFQDLKQYTGEYDEQHFEFQLTSYRVGGLYNWHRDNWPRSTWRNWTALVYLTPPLRKAVRRSSC